MGIIADFIRRHKRLPELEGDAFIRKILSSMGVDDKFEKLTEDSAVEDLYRIKRYYKRNGASTKVIWDISLISNDINNPTRYTATLTKPSSKKVRVIQGNYLKDILESEKEGW